MLSDRIKKFGLQSNTEPGSDQKTEQPDGAAVTDSTVDEGGSAQDKVAGAKAVPSASNDNAAQQTAAAAAEDATEQAKQALREAFERADAERSDAAEQYVAQKLEGAIHRPASRAQPNRIKNADDKADADSIKTQHIGLGYLHHLSKRTHLYVTGGVKKTDGEKHVRAMDMGVSHSF